MYDGKQPSSDLCFILFSAMGPIFKQDHIHFKMDKIFLLIQIDFMFIPLVYMFIQSIGVATLRNMNI